MKPSPAQIEALWMSDIRKSYNEYLQKIDLDLQDLLKGIPERLLPQTTQDFTFVVGHLPESLQPLRHYKFTINGHAVDERWLVRKSHFDEAYPSAD